MREPWIRTVLVELVGVFGLIFFSAGVVCMNHLTTPGMPTPTAPLTLHEPGLFGVALAQGVILAVLLALTVPVSGGYLNPAATIALWAFGRIDSKRTVALLGAQLLGSVLAATALRLMLKADVLALARFGAPHINVGFAYPSQLNQYTVLAGSGIELLLTFFLALAMFAPIGSAGDPARASLAPGMVQTAAALFAFPLTGAALNPARWFGPVVWEWATESASDTSPWADFLVYLSGPVLGALLAALFCARLFPAPAPPTTAKKA
jgi:aquaporin Z